MTFALWRVLTWPFIEWERRADGVRYWWYCRSWVACTGFVLGIFAAEGE